MSAIWGGIWISLKGMSGTGLTAIISALVALVGIFVYGKAGQKKELAEKAKGLTPSQFTSGDESTTHSQERSNKLA